jgi:hypothetical protein
MSCSIEDRLVVLFQSSSIQSMRKLISIYLIGNLSKKEAPHNHQFSGFEETKDTSPQNVFCMRLFTIYSHIQDQVSFVENPI